MTPRGARTFARGRSPGGRRCCGAALSGASRPPRPSPRGAKVAQMCGAGSPAPCGCSSGFRSAPHRPLPPQNRLDPIFEAGAADTRSEQRRAEAEHRSSSRDGFGPPAIERRPKSVSHFLSGHPNPAEDSATRNSRCCILTSRTPCCDPRARGPSARPRQPPSPNDGTRRNDAALPTAVADAPLKPVSRSHGRSRVNRQRPRCRRSSRARRA